MAAAAPTAAPHAIKVAADLLRNGKKTLLILGNEGRGASPEIMQACDARVRIPLHSPVESLNVAAAGAAILFEAVRQRR